jgi:hypothetical protein
MHWVTVSLTATAIMQTTVLMLACMVGLAGIGAAFRANLYRWWLSSLIKLDPRYQMDPTWRREADRALWRFKEAQFALSNGLIPFIPWWVPLLPYVFVTCVIVELLLWTQLAEYFPRFVSAPWQTH